MLHHMPKPSRGHPSISDAQIGKRFYKPSNVLYLQLCMESKSSGYCRRRGICYVSCFRLLSPFWIINLEVIPLLSEKERGWTSLQTWGISFKFQKQQGSMCVILLSLGYFVCNKVITETKSLRKNSAFNLLCLSCSPSVPETEGQTTGEALGQVRLRSRKKMSMVKMRTVGEAKSLSHVDSLWPHGL